MASSWIKRASAAGCVWRTRARRRGACSSEVSLDADALDIERKVFGDAASALASFWSDLENTLLGDFTKACDAKSYAACHKQYAALVRL